MTEKNINPVSSFRKYARYRYDCLDFNIFEICETAKGGAANKSEAAELVAVYLTIQTLEFVGKTETANAIRAVYFRYANRPLKKNEISWRVRSFANEIYMDERTVYRHLKTAKELFLKFYENGIKNI
ncbi:MAG: hypothetical protein IJW79_06040 [Clostridia bacterium]|nr:hypothetical protein [Clostridia bacterium]